MESNESVVKRKSVTNTSNTTTTESVDESCSNVKKQAVYKKRTDTFFLKTFRGIIGFSWAIIITSVMWVVLPFIVILKPILKALGSKRWLRDSPLDVLSRVWARVILWVVNVNVIIEDDHYVKQCNTKSTILMYSHASNIDPIILMGYTPITTRFIFKKELLFFVPYIFYLAYIIGHIPINRKKRQSAFESINIAAANVKDNKLCVVISPEGTRSADGILQPFKKGPFHMAIQSKAVIAPVCLFGNHELWPTKDLLPNNGTVHVRYLPPFEIGPNDNVDSLLEKTRSLMHEALVNPPKNFEPLKSGPQFNHSLIFFSGLLIITSAFLRYFGYF
ncbi:hypothetical protein PPL_03818 [Heterostelium album PN500]|uniref:Phospholipid/glycerol acyltransferase domain-containing protein n=1 Tax=Heterostelium pallidum (strain ATCC 26659 / Pp 5 / PN500) TaxID=670386 RepID=D3B6R3_HETP5|nr:hypothetical protein PPL_03818 [Heterostelium album PN500]EFA83033.1 hypothetical protein PPL_03818 [Heterostelium album PN500]|eukprot:XP_020435150.1 hypothetical protein PPL_03818 [Heterostelium album PN500]